MKNETSLIQQQQQQHQTQQTHHLKMGTPKPRLDIFKESPHLLSKKCRTSTPSVRPPKPPMKSTKSSRSFCSANTNNDPYCRLFKEFEIKSKIGKGDFADVYEAKSYKDNKFYAIKRTSIPFLSNSDRLRKLQEVRNHQQLPPHPNCVRYVDSWEEDGFLYIQTELCKTSLNEVLEKSEEHKLPEQKVWSLLLDLLSAVKHLHDHDLIHMDIKPDNIFISFDNVAKLGDFGLMHNALDLNSSMDEFDISFNNNSINDHDDSGIINRSDESIDSIDEGDSKYLASETMQGKFTKAADIFSLGITIFEVASGLDLPKCGESYHKLRHNEIEDLYFNGLSKDLINIIKSMMEEDYTRRPTIDELLQYDAIRSRKLDRHTLIF